MRTVETFAAFVLLDRSGCWSADCIMPTSVVPSGVTVRPSMPLFGTRLASSAGREPSKGDRRSMARPLRSKCVMYGPYSSDTQKVPSGMATRPSES
jgi:hypothetical protein